MAWTQDGVDGVVTNAVLFALALLTVAMRFTARIKSSASLQWDDWTILIALFVSAAMCVSLIWATCVNIKGVPFSSMTHETYVSWRKIIYADIFLTHFVYGLIKISVLLFYKRIFTLNRKFNMTSNILLAAAAIFIIGSIFAVLFCMGKPSTFWTASPLVDTKASRVVFPTVLTTAAVIDIILDLCILVLPVSVISRLNLPLGRKLSVIAVFLSGGFCLVSSIVRLYYVRALVGHRRGDGAGSLKLSDANDLWAHIEAFASIITACLPTLGPLLRTHRGLESLIGSVRSLFTIRSRSKSDINSSRDRLPRDTQEASHKREKRAWYELSTKGSEPATCVGGTEIDLDAEAQQSDVILVQRTLSVHDEKWV